MAASASEVASAPIKRLEGKVALITGAARGLGECTARLFTQHGAKVVIADILDDLGHSVSQTIPGSTYVHCDVTNEKDVENAVDTAVSKYGKLDIMFNNAGLGDYNKDNILDNDLADFQKVVNVNLIGVFLGTKHAARVMIPARSGNIINTASVCSIAGGLSSHAYTSSKHGVLGLTKNTAVELGRYGIRVNCVSPYVVATPMAKEFFRLDDEGVHNIYSPLKGAAIEPQDFAEAALFLASNESKFVNGHNLVADGGYTITNYGFTIFK
ncbi:borneol dehydrogenase, mitochondrial-like [Prosopis cineraria]|uniref:borneol dehydrogenase, mitochondrial-like n=1 Tax=Prosopis cineraria TaxID=364024 RepID=UPI00241006E8|nr:borneol dehydrogenase, mitochondrial-like [Prosopis cineraria]